MSGIMGLVKEAGNFKSMNEAWEHYAESLKERTKGCGVDQGFCEDCMKTAFYMGGIIADRRMSKLATGVVEGKVSKEDGRKSRAEMMREFEEFLLDRLAMGSLGDLLEAMLQSEERAKAAHTN